MTGAVASFENIIVSDFEFNHTEALFAHLNFGKLNILHSTFTNIASPLFRLSSMSVRFDQVTINQITCNTSMPCLIRGESIELEMLNSDITDIVSNTELITFSTCTSIYLFDLKILDILKYNHDNTENLFAIQANNVNNFTIEDSHFQGLEFSFVNGNKSNVKVSKTIFSNQVKTRLLPSANSVKAINFIYLEESNSLISGSSFFGSESTFGEVIKIINKPDLHIRLSILLDKKGSIGFQRVLSKITMLRMEQLFILEAQLKCLKFKIVSSKITMLLNSEEPFSFQIKVEFKKFLLFILH